ncbi:unnamed protein product, partial [Protopolystoma xenopodis]
MPALPHVIPFSPEACRHSGGRWHADLVSQSIPPFNAFWLQVLLFSCPSNPVLKLCCTCRLTQAASLSGEKGDRPGKTCRPPACPASTAWPVAWPAARQKHRQSGQPANQPASQPDNQTPQQPMGQPGARTASQTVDQSNSRPASQLARRMVRGTAQNMLSYLNFAQ